MFHSFLIAFFLDILTKLQIRLRPDLEIANPIQFYLKHAILMLNIIFWEPHTLPPGAEARCLGCLGCLMLLPIFLYAFAA